MRTIMSKNRISNAVVVATSAQRISGIKKHISSKTEIPVGGAMVKPATLLALFQGSLDASDNVASTRGEYRAAVAARDANEAERLVTDEALKQWVLQRFGAGSSEAHDFGYAPRKVGKVTAATRANAVLLNQATREARGTMGKRKKLKIKGTLPVPAAPAPPATPAVQAALPASTPVVQAAPVTNGVAPVTNGASH
jgi:hypothetical protein